MLNTNMRGKPYHWPPYTLRAQMVDALLDYVEHRTEPGGFLTAALSNDFVGCVGRADADNERNLPALAGFLYNEMPAGMWGSPEKVKKHLNPSRKD